MPEKVILRLFRGEDDYTRLAAILTASENADNLPVALFTWLPTYRVLMVWVSNRTESKFLHILMAASLVTFWTSFTPQAALAGMRLAIFYLVLTAALWIVLQ
jgi:uncharacterized protein